MFEAFGALFELDTLWTVVRIVVTVATIVTVNVFIGSQPRSNIDDQDEFNDFESFSTSSIYNRIVKPTT